MSEANYRGGGMQGEKMFLSTVVNWLEADCKVDYKKGRDLNRLNDWPALICDFTKILTLIKN